ncbi:hypothetical protein DFH06DRAFT_1333136 [Mycena polygramma]|nr:hypothetical protein DFH06DRAFT_1333136 [Mycena polygramma]
MSDLPLWMSDGVVQTIPVGAPSRVVHVPREEDSETRKADFEGIHLKVHRLVQARTTAIDMELSRLKWKRTKLNTALEYEVLRRLLKSIDKEAKAHLTSEEIWTLKRANFNWC